MADDTGNAGNDAGQDAPTGTAQLNRIEQRIQAAAANAAGDDASEEALPDTVKAILTKERKAAREARDAQKALEARVREFEDRDKTEQEKAKEALTATERRATEAEAKLLRFEVAAEKKLDPDLVQFLNASTKEDLEKQADALVEKFSVKSVPNLGQGVRGAAAGTAPDMNAALRRAAGRG